jgi:TonB family protein
MLRFARLSFLAVLVAVPAGAQEVQPPKVLSRAPAAYPPGHHELSSVGLIVTIDETGAVTAVEPTQTTDPALNTAAEDAVRHWTFAPATRDGKPFKVRVKISFDFPKQETPPPRPSPPVTPAPGANGSAPAGAAPAPNGAGGSPSSSVQPVRAGATVIGVRNNSPPHSGTDERIGIGALGDVVEGSPEKILELAPGIFIANEGGAGHADQVFLRGFDAETGSALEFTVNGLPLNQVNNPDGHGYADTHFIIPEVVDTLHIIEGPFDPHQGDFAVAGSADYQLGVRDRGLRIQNDYGSFNTERVLALWAPVGESTGTFGAAQFESSDGFGENRASQAASAMAQYEGVFGARGTWRLLGIAYGINYKSAGPIRLADIQQGFVGFYGTEDPSQGGNAQRYSLVFDLQNPIGEGIASLQVFTSYITDQIIENFTGFLLDYPEFGQSPHPQRGDAIQQQYSAITAGSRGGYRLTHTFFGLAQSLELGYYFRFDHTTPSIDRLRFGTDTPYLVDEDLTTNIVNLAGYADLDLHPTPWLTVRGGLRQEFFGYNVVNNCATNGEYRVSQPLDQTCPAYDNSGPRLPAEQVTASGQITEPKVGVIAQFPQGVSLTGSYGLGAQSIDAQYISEGENAPFSVVNAGEVGALYHHQWEAFDLQARLVGYYTHVGQDLIFNPELGRLSSSVGTTRMGGLGEARLTGRWLDELISATYAHATFDASGGELVPYVPEWIARSATSVHGALPWTLRDHALVGSVGLELSYVGVRALPYGQAAAPTFVMDANASIRWRWIKLGVRAENLLNSQYPLSEFFYASYFGHQEYPTLVPTEAITAAPPFSVTFTVALLLDEGANR